MRRWLHVVMPLVVGAAVFAAQVNLVTPIGRTTFTFIVGALAKSCGIIGAFVAATAFDRGDYLRRAWLLIVVNYAFITFNFLLAGFSKPLLFGLSAIHLPGLDPQSLTAEYIRSIGVIIGNTLGVVGTVLLARAWSVAGLEPTRPLVRWSVIGGALVLAVLLSGTAGYRDLQDMAHAPSMHVGLSVASDAGDFVSFVLIAPMLLTALALRGGMLVWPWALYTGSALTWMLFDAVMNIDPPSVTTLALGEWARVSACLLSFSAGLAQRHVVHGGQRAMRA